MEFRGALVRHPEGSVAAGAAGASREQPGDVYRIEFDGASKGNPGRAGAGALVRHPDGSVVCELREGLGTASNNVAEYRSFLLDLKGALDRGIYRVRVQGDSDLLVKQILGKYRVRHPDLIPLCAVAHRLIQNFAEFSIRHVDRRQSSPAILQLCAYNYSGIFRLRQIFSMVLGRFIKDGLRLIDSVNLFIFQSAHSLNSSGTLYPVDIRIL